MGSGLLHPNRELPRARELHHAGESLRLGTGGRAPRRRQSVVATSRVVERRVDARFDLTDEAVLEQARERAIQRAGPELNRVAAVAGYLLHDSVAVPVRVDEREQDMELDRRDAGTLVGLHCAFRHLYRLPIYYIGRRYSTSTGD